MLITLHSNASQACGKLGMWQQSLSHAVAAMKLAPGHIKAMFRAVAALLELERFDEACRLLGEGDVLDPPAFRSLRGEMTRRVRERRMREKSVWQRVASPTLSAPSCGPTPSPRLRRHPLEISLGWSRCDAVDGGAQSCVNDYRYD